MEGLVLKNISKNFKNQYGNENCVLKDISFSLKKGECISIIGESGCGKSTLMKIILGLIRPTAGDILIDGESIINLSDKEFLKKRTIIQGVFQDASGSLNEYLSTYDNIQEALINLTDLKKNERKDRIIKLMDKLCIKRELLKTPIKMLSGGEKRRIALLRSLLVKPKYLFLDEVVSGLDSISSNAVLETLEEYKKIYGCSYLFVTHNLNSAYKLSDRIIVLDNGKITKIAKKDM